MKPPKDMTDAQLENELMHLRLNIDERKKLENGLLTLSKNDLNKILHIRREQYKRSQKNG